MKQMFALLILCLVACSTAFAQQSKPTLKITANSTIVTNGVIELKDQKRILWFVTDGMPSNSGYAYEFGPLTLVAANGDRVPLKPKEVCNGPLFHYSISNTYLKQYPQGFEIELAEIKRHNPDHSSEVLPFTAKDLKLKIVPAPATAPSPAPSK
jgi:hypothetical protein